VYDSADENIVTKIEANKNKSVILTFDDGPGRVLPQILDILMLEKVPATFFWQTRLLYLERPWKRVLDEGHQIGTHSTKHLNLTMLNYEEQYQDLKNSVDMIENVTGREVTYFRPPFGRYNDDTINAAKELNLIPVLWRISSMDWELKKNPEKIITNVTEHLESGAIILLHELQQTAVVLSDLIKEIKAKGFQIIRLEKLNSKSLD
jgi:peptidoglycan/xylan/chitin deacetylase (PgdA/CDA1 family)